MNPFPCQVYVELIYLISIRLNNFVGDEPVTFKMWSLFLTEMRFHTSKYNIKNNKYTDINNKYMNPSSFFLNPKFRLANLPCSQVSYGHIVYNRYFLQTKLVACHKVC